MSTINNDTDRHVRLTELPELPCDFSNGEDVPRRAREWPTFAARPPVALKLSINEVRHMPIYNHDVDENLPGIGRIGANHHLPRHWGV